MSDLSDVFDFITAAPAAKSAFSRHARPGDQVTGEIVSAAKEHRTDKTGRKLYWLDGKPTAEETGQPIIRAVLTLDTGITDPADPADEGMRTLYVEGEVRRALRTAMLRAGVKGMAVGDRIEGFTYTADVDGRRQFDGGCYVPRKAKASL